MENSSKLGGIRLRQPLPRSEELLCHVREALTPDWRNFLICIDGADGIGKSSLASWLAWQLGAATIHLDLYSAGQSPAAVENRQRVIDTRLKIGPAIIEGVLALDALEEAQRSPDFLIFVDGNSSSRQLGPEIAAYTARRHPRDRANFTLRGFLE